MKTLLPLILLALCAPSEAQFHRNNGETSNVIGPLCIPEFTGSELFDVDFNTANLQIDIYASGNGVNTAFSYTGGNIDDYDGAPPAWGAPASSAVEVEDDDECVRLHIRDEVFSVSGATEWAIKFTDGASDNIMDWTFYVTADSDDFVIQSGTCDSGSTTTCVDAALTETDSGYWRRGVAIKFTSGTIQNQTFCITAFADGTDTLTFTPAATQAVSTNSYTLIVDAICGGVGAL